MNPSFGSSSLRLAAAMTGLPHVLIHATMKDGTKRSGLFGSKSHASERTADGDLYIERLVEVKEGGGFKIISTSLGVLIKQEDILSLEFVSVTQDNPPNKETVDAEREASKTTAARDTERQGITHPATHDGQPTDHSRKRVPRQRGSSNGGNSTAHSTQRQEVRAGLIQPASSPSESGSSITDDP